MLRANHPNSLAGCIRSTAKVVIVSAFTLLATPVLAQEDSLCLDCHDDPDNDMIFDREALKHSVHSDQSCIDCHDDLAGMTEDHDKVKRVDCSGCHEDEVAAYKDSEHGRAVAGGVKEAATCTDCHGKPHAILPSGKTNSPTHYLNIPMTCGTCHAKPEVMARYSPNKQHAVVDYSNSVHGIVLREGEKHAAVCTDCHGDHGIYKGTNPKSRMYWMTIPKTCGKCHDEVLDVFSKSVHGKAAAEGQRDAPVCTDCHGEHTIAAIKDVTSQVSAAHIPETCGQCHASERITSRYTLATGVLDTYMQSFHGLAAQIGGVEAANCASCHGYHDILPSSDPQSSINREKLPETCGKCHPGIGTRLAQGTMRIHEPPGAGPGKPPIVNMVARAYIILTIMIIGGMFAFNSLDFSAKLRAHIREVRGLPNKELRMTPALRAQHTVLVITFILLAYTGFVHKFPDAIWSWPFRALPDGSHWRGLVHRIAGWLFTAMFFIHLFLLFFTSRGRAYLKHLRPELHDAVDSMLMLRRNLGLGGPGPGARRFNFAEKAEYWALIWGSLVMIVTGVMLIFTSITLRLLPQVWLEVAMVAHYYEAILASLAIVVWHFYWVIFDPHEYPLNTGWTTGYKRPLHGHEGESDQ